jgi:hypothetical protein
MIPRPKSSIPNGRNLSQLNLEKNKKINSNDDITLNQSPKISSGKFRSLLTNRNNFSLLDINDKVTNSRGTSLPIQYKRLTSKEVKELFNIEKLENYKKFQKMKYNSMKNIFLEKNKIANKTKHQNIINKKNFEKNYETDIINNKTDICDNINNNTNNSCIKNEIKKIKKDNIIISKRPQTSKANNRKKIIFEEEKKNNEKTYKIKDIWKPLNYEEYEEMVNDKKKLIKKMQKNPFFTRLPQCSIKEIKEKVNHSDIFFLQKNNKENIDLEHNNNYIKKKNYNIYFNSDIFNIKNDEINIKKIGEKYLFNNQNNIKYTSSKESQSSWQNNIYKDPINNFSSKNYNILSPNRKNNFLNKDDIYKSLKKKPLNKQKGLGNYMDSANNNSSHFGQEYSKCYKSNPNCFKKVTEICANFGDLFLHYKNMCDKPFHKIKILDK